MKIKLLILPLVAIVVAAGSCVKNPETPQPDGPQTDPGTVKEMAVPAGFDWKMSRGITCNFASAHLTRVYVASAADVEPFAVVFAGELGYNSRVARDYWEFPLPVIRDRHFPLGKPENIKRPTVHSLRKNFLFWEQPSRIPFLPTAKSLWTWPPGPRKQWNRPRAPIMSVPTGGISSILLSAGVR